MRLKEGNKDKRIIEAAIQIFAENGYHKAKISEIAKRAGVATGSVYVYFKNKQAILLKIFENIWKPLFVELKKVADNKEFSHEEKLDFLIDLVFDFFIENPSMAIVFVNEQHYLLRTQKEAFTNYYIRFMEQGELILRRGIKEKVFNDLDIKIFRYFILGGLRNLLSIWAENPSEVSLNKIRQNVKFLTKHGILK
jgi:TetR/AcrR family fatty acid metabolism transcriptional regulator